MSRLETIGACCALALAGLAVLPEPAAAHGLVGRADLPIPAWLFGWAAAVVLIVSFAGLALLWKDPQLQEANFRPLPDRLSRAVLNRVTEAIAAVVGVGLLVLTIWSGLAGVQAVQDNFAPTFIYVIFWVGLVLLSIALGDIFRAFNPWRVIGRAGGFVSQPDDPEHAATVSLSRLAGPLARRPWACSPSPGWSWRTPIAMTLRHSRSPRWCTR